LVGLRPVAADSLAQSTAIRTDSAGKFSFSTLLPGRYRVIARAIGYLPLDTVCQVLEGKVDTLVLVLDRAIVGRISVRPLHERPAAPNHSERSC
jgi:hypothetical protein